MRVLVIGGSGLIGAAVVARLRQAQLPVRVVGRSGAANFGAGEFVRADLRHMLRPEDWAPHLTGIGAVVYCAGVLQDGAADSTRLVQRDAPNALYAACERAGVRRVVHFSAMGAGEKGLTPFMQTKHEAEEGLKARDLDWVIVRPAIVVGGAAYGGSALIRGLASLPIVPRLPSAGRIQIAQLDEIAETAVLMVAEGAPARLVLEVAHPETFAFEEVVARYRKWLGWRPASLVTVPGWAMSLAYWAGDIAGYFGWRPPVRSTARREMTRGAVGNPQTWIEVTGIRPRSLDEALWAQPASVQERWFAKLYLLKPVVFVAFAAFWIATALISLGPGFEIGKALLQEGGVGTFSGLGVMGGALADLVLGAALLFKRTARLALFGTLGLSLFYLVMGTILLPQLWIDPLGPMLKVWPIIALNLVALAILDDR